MPVRRSVSGGRRRRRSVSSKRVPSRRRKSTRKRRSGSSTSHQSAPIKVEGTFTGYDVKNKKKVTIKNPKLIKITKGKGVRGMIKGESPLAPHNTVVTFISPADPKVKKYF